MNMREKLTAACAALVLIPCAFAWDVEHDVVAQLATEGLPAEIRAKWTGDDALDIVRFCHYPDMDETVVPSRFHTLEELGAIVGAEDLAEMKSAGAKSAHFFHGNSGIVTLVHLLAKAFKANDTAKSAFYFGVLTHTLADRSSLNHTPLLHWMYCRYEGVNMRVESPERGRFGQPVTFTPQGPVTARVRARLAVRKPKLLAEDFIEAAVRALEGQTELSSLSAQLEAKIAWGGEDEAKEALAQLVAAQVGAMDDVCWTAWKLRAQARPVTKETIDRAEARFEAVARKCDPAKEAVFRDVFDEALNPAKPRATIGVVCENYRGLSSALSFGGKAIVAAAARTLRDSGYAVKGLNLWTVATLPDPKEMPLVILALKDLKDGEKSTIPDSFLGAVGRYREAGGRILAIGGTDPGGITAMRPSFKPLPDAALPVVGAWGQTNGEAWKRRGVICASALKRTASAPHPFVHNPSAGAATKPICRFEVQTGHAVYPLAWFYDNAPEGGQHLVAARSVNVAWVPEYFFAPFVLSQDKSVDWTDLRLDSFGAAFLLDVVEDMLFGDPLAARPARRTDGWWSSGVPESHLKAIADNKSGHFDLVMVGDSITHRWMQTDKGGAETWPQLTNEFSVLNLGIGADRTQHVLWRLQHGELDGYTADVFTLLIGVNNTGTDPAEDIAEGTRRIVALIRAKHPESTILLMPIFPHGKTPSDPQSPSARANAITKTFADGDKVRLFDIRQKFLDEKGNLLPGMMFVDDLHPIAGGYRVWYDSLVPEVRSLLKK